MRESKKQIHPCFSTARADGIVAVELSDDTGRGVSIMIMALPLAIPSV
jgi:hypothetical protein